ncbi:MAG: S8 family serine peptidase [Fimbriimonadales bacterium]
MRITHGLLGLLSIMFTLQLGVAQLSADESHLPSLNPTEITEPFVPGELVVGVESSALALPVTALEMVGIIVSHNAAIDAYVVRLADDIDMQSAGEFLRAIPGVRYVEPNYLAFAFATPNDPRFGQQYGPTRIQAHLAWDIW